MVSKVHFFRVLVTFEPGRSLPQFVTTNCLILHSQGILSLLTTGVDPFICACLWTWYRKVPIRVRVGGNVSNGINIRRGIKLCSVLSPVIFNNAICWATCHLPPYLIEPYVDASHLSYTDDILLLSCDLQGLQKAADSV